MKRLLQTVLILSFSVLGYSQTIINAERLIAGVDSSIYSLALSYSGAQGNLNTTQIAISPNIVFIRKSNEYKILGGYSFFSQEDVHILNSGFIHLRHNYRINERLKTFAFFQAQFNEVLLLNYRDLYGAGLRYQLIKRDSVKLDFNIGPMREYEQLNISSLRPGEISETRYTRANFVCSFNWKAGKSFSLLNVLYYQPYLASFNDYRVLNDINLVVSISKYFSFITSLTTRYDNLPPGELVKLDNALSVGINLKF